MYVLPIAVAMLTAAMLTSEILQTITMSLQAFSQNAFFVISIALLGLGCGGSLTAWLGARKAIDAARVLWWSALGFAATSVICALLSSRLHGILPLILASVPPYVFAGTFLGVLFASWPKRTSQLYCFDLLGSAVGCLAVVGLLAVTGSAPVVILLASALGFAAASVIGLATSRTRGLVPLVGVVATLATIPLADALFPYAPNQAKHYGMMLADPKIETTREGSEWNYLGRLDVVRPGAGAERFHYGGTAAKVLAQGGDFRYLFASGDNWSYAIDFKGHDEVRRAYLRAAPQASPYAVVGAKPDVLVIGVGGGVDVFLALSQGARSVTAIDINPSMVAAVRRLGPRFWDGAFRDPRLVIHELDGRTWVDTTSSTYDVITLTAVDTGAGLAHGGMMLSENYLYTEEAFDRYLALLRPGGVLYVKRPAKQLQRTLATAVDALRRRGVTQPDRHLAVFGRDWVDALIFRDPIGEAQAATLSTRIAAGELGGTLLHLPGVALPPNRFTPFFDFVRAGDLAGFHRATEGAFTPIVDDRPFFYYHATSFLGSPAGSTLLEILAWVGLVSVVLLFVPLLRIRPPAGAVLVPSVVYFFGIGLGFMLIEISLMQKLVLFLGHPARSISVTLFGLLVFTGIGSLWSGRFAERADRALRVALPAIAALALVASVTLGGVLGAVTTASLVARIAIALALLAPAGIVMGLAFPLAVRLLAERSAAMVPWAWAVNAFASVIGSVLATMLAMTAGFNAVLMCSAACYLVALVGHLRGRATA